MRNRLLLMLFAVVVALVAGLAVFLSFQEIPAPTTRIEKVIPNDRLPR